LKKYILVARYIIELISFQIDDTVRSPSAAPTIGMTGLCDTKFQIAPMMASPAAMGQRVPAT
jgi:hypothetical protein